MSHRRSAGAGGEAHDNWAGTGWPNKTAAKKNLRVFFLHWGPVRRGRRLGFNTPPTSGAWRREVLKDRAGDLAAFTPWGRSPVHSVPVSICRPLSHPRAPDVGLAGSLASG